MASEMIIDKSKHEQFQMQYYSKAYKVNLSKSS